jgi:hypothetical protein
MPIPEEPLLQLRSRLERSLFLLMASALVPSPAFEDRSAFSAPIELVRLDHKMSNHNIDDSLHGRFLFLQLRPSVVSFSLCDA